VFVLQEKQALLQLLQLLITRQQSSFYAC